MKHHAAKVRPLIVRNQKNMKKGVRMLNATTTKKSALLVPP
jgi:hypothetical protein